MRRLLILILALVALSTSAWAATPNAPKVLLFTPPLNQPASCASQTANGYYCGFRSLLNTSYVSGFSVAINWTTVETSQGVYNFNAFDATIQEFTGFNATASCDGSHCVYTLSSSIGGTPLYQTGEQIVVWGMSNASANTGAGGCSLTAVNNLTPSVTCASSFNGSATGGFVATACGGNRCLFDLAVIHEGYGGNNTNSPSYPYTSAWATSCCSAPPLDVIFDAEYHNGACAGGIPLWVANHSYLTNSYVTGTTDGTCGNFNAHYYLETAANCTSGGSAPAFPTNGTSVNDNGCTWLDEGFGITANANSTSPTITSAVLSSGLAAGWEAPWLAAWNNLASAAISHYAGVSWAAQILNMRWGLVVGGERYLFGSKTSESLVTPSNAATMRSTWLNALATIDGYVKTYSTTYVAPFANMAVGNGCTAFSSNRGNIVDQTWTGAEYLEAYSNGFNLGTEGLQTADVTNLNSGYPCVTSPPPGVGNDYAYNALLYGPSVAWFEAQTTQQSAPTGCSDCTASETQTGSLTQLLPFAAQHHINLLELYAGDFLCAELAAYTGPPTNTECAATSPSYHQTLLNFAGGGGSFTSEIGGNSSLRGNASVH